jgi:uncharacterized oxidoreductase
MHPPSHRVLITGGAKGIGLALAKQFHAYQNEVILVDRDATALAQAATQLPGAATVVADIALATDRRQLLKQFGNITVLINNAGIQHNGPLNQLSAADIESELQTNLLAPVLLTHAFLPQLLQQPQAAIVNVTSVLALSPKESASVYCASKAALRSFSQLLRWQLESGPIKVFEVIPPLVDTQMTQGRGKGKISANKVAADFWQGFINNQFEIPIGKARAAKWLNRLAPSLVARLMRSG